MQLIRPYILPLLLLGTFCVAFYPSLELFVQKWSSSDDYTHAFFTVPIVGYMIWQKREVLGQGKGWPVAGLCLIVFFTTFYLFALKLQIPSFIFVATHLTIISCLVYFAGLIVIKELMIPVLLLFMLVPIPDQILSLVTASLQIKISEISKVVIQATAVPVFSEGNILHIPSKSFMVAEACSGIRSLISMTTLSLIIGYFTLINPITRTLLFLFSIPVALIVNIIRVVTLILAYHYYAIDLSLGAPHTATGLALFVFGMILLFTFQQVLEWWEKRKKNT